MFKIPYTTVPDNFEVGLSLSLVRRPKYEKKDTFKNRSSGFKSYLNPFRSKKILDWVKKVYSEFDNNPDYSYFDFNNFINTTGVLINVLERNLVVY